MVAIAVIILAPQSPDALNLCLESLQQQTMLDFECLLAVRAGDDRHAKVIEKHQHRMGDRLRSVAWAGDPVADAGSPAKQLNAAILATEAEYLVFSEGTCLFQPAGMAAHQAAAEYGFFVHGEALGLDQAITEQVSEATIATGQAFSAEWLKSVSARWYRKHFHVGMLEMLRHWWVARTHREQLWNGSVGACFHADMVGINGFDAAVAQKHMERDMANRLLNYGLAPSKLPPQGNVLRLDTGLLQDQTQAPGQAPVGIDPGAEYQARDGLRELDRTR